MAGKAEARAVPLKKRVTLLSFFPCFAQFSQRQHEEMARLMLETHYQPDEVIVRENDLVDSIYVIVKGDAEVTRLLSDKKKSKSIPVALLHAGEAIGLNDTGFYSETGKRTATVAALTEMLTLRLSLDDLSDVLKKNNLESTMKSAAHLMQRMRFIKQTLPFAKLSHQRLQWLSERVEEIHLSKGETVFKQGDKGDCCYLIAKGTIAVDVDEAGHKKQLDVLKAPTLLGEATLVTHSSRNATATVMDAADLFVLRHEHLTELVETESNVASMLMTLMVDRSRPLQNNHVSKHERQAADGQTIVILKNPDNDHYFKLSVEGEFIWQQLDGNHSLQEITLDLADKFNLFAPDMVAALIAKLARAGFVTEVAVDGVKTRVKPPLWVRVMTKVRGILEMRYAFGDINGWVTRVYQRGIRYLFSTPATLIFTMIIAMGLFSFFDNTHAVLTFFSHHRVNLLLLLLIIPLSYIEVIFHELGHAFAVKAVGRDVHYLGVGWYWLVPIAFTDTTDMWLANRRARMFVNLAGVYVDVIIAGIASLFIFMIANPYFQAILWLFALYTYVNAFRQLSPLQEMDGYYALNDWLEKNHLRKDAIMWLIKIFPRSCQRPILFIKHRAEILYWVACLLYLALLTLLTLTLQLFVFKMLGIQSANPYLSLLLPLFVVILSIVSVMAEIRSQAEG